MNPDPDRRFVVCGETLIDLVRDERDPGDTFASGWQALSAGGPMNIAVALARLGANSHFLGRISTDEFGGQLRGHMIKAGVDLDLAVTSDQFTSLAVLSLDEQGKASYAFHFDETANFSWQPDELPELTSRDWLQIGSLPIVVPPGDRVLLDWVRGVPASISLDINVRPTVITDPAEYWRRVRPWLQALAGKGVVKASDDDVAFLARGLEVDETTDGRVVSSGDSAADLPPSSQPEPWRGTSERWLADFDLPLIVITRGESGASALTADGWTDVPGYRAELVDTVGAGDTFMAGFLDGYVRLGQDLAEALRRGASAASIVCSRQGAQPPTAEEVVALQRGA
ncbi:MAG TPA: carbohydrate kinase [Microlunatus sp.]